MDRPLSEEGLTDETPCLILLPCSPRRFGPDNAVLRHRRSGAGGRAGQRQPAGDRPVGPRRGGAGRGAGRSEPCPPDLQPGRTVRLCLRPRRRADQGGHADARTSSARIVQAGNSIGGAISDDGRLVAVSNYEPGGVRVFDADTLELVADIPRRRQDHRPGRCAGTPLCLDDLGHGRGASGRFLGAGHR